MKSTGEFTGGNCVRCGDPAVGLCCWPVKRYVVLTVGDMEAGDFVQPMEQSTNGSTFEILYVGIKGRPKLQFKYRVREPMAVPRMIEQDYDCAQSIKILRDDLCAQPVCEAHLREPWDGKVHCVDHWNAWEGVSNAAA